MAGSKVRLLCIGRDLRGGGAERIQLALLEQLDRSKFDIRLFYLKDAGVLQTLMPPCIAPVYGAAAKANLKTRAISLLAKLIYMARQSDLVFAMQEGTPVYLASIAGQLTRRPVVGWIRICWSRMLRDLASWHRWASRLLYPRTSLLVCGSEGVARDLVSFSPVLDGRVISIPNPQRLDRIYNEALAPLPRWADEIFEKRTILAAGRLVSQKGFDVLLKALAQLTNNGHDLHLVILGEGEERVRLEDLTKQLGLSGRVFMPGFQLNPYPFFAHANVFVLSSRYEGFANVIVEALALALPVIATDCPHGPREILEDGRWGIVVPPEDPAALANGIEGLLASPERWSRLCSVGPNRASRYDVRAVARDFENMLLECLRKRHAEN